MADAGSPHADRNSFDIFAHPPFAVVSDVCETIPLVHDPPTSLDEKTLSVMKRLGGLPNCCEILVRQLLRLHWLIAAPVEWAAQVSALLVGMYMPQLTLSNGLEYSDCCSDAWHVALLVPQQ